jgi:hypothetical protein
MIMDIKYCTPTGFDSEIKNNEFCIPCYYSGLGRLIPSPKKEEKGDSLYCRNCGKSYSMDDIAKTTKIISLKSLNKPQQTSGPFVISQKRKGKDKPRFDSPNNELTEDDLKDLRSMGYRV